MVYLSALLNSDTTENQTLDLLIVSPTS